MSTKKVRYKEWIPSPHLLSFLGQNDVGQLSHFRVSNKFHLDFRVEVPILSWYIPNNMNALLSTQAVAGFTIVQSASIYSFQYMYLGAMSAIGVGFTSARIAIGSDTLVLKGRGLDRLVELMTHRLLVKLYLVDKFEDISSDVRQSDNDFVWVSGFNIEVPQTQ